MFEKYKKVYKADYEKWYKENEAYRERVAADQDRLKFHLMPKTGWLNDPNGLCQFNGTYHIYYQMKTLMPMVSIPALHLLKMIRSTISTQEI